MLLIMNYDLKGNKIDVDFHSKLSIIKHKSNIGFVTEFFSDHGHLFQNDLDEKSLNILVHVCRTGTIRTSRIPSGKCLFYLGSYCHIMKNTELAIKNYLAAIDHGIVEAMNSLAHLYEEISDFDNMIKYYVMAADYGDVDAMNILIQYYHDNGQYENKIKYCIMSANSGNIRAIFILARHYDCMKEYENAIKYYSMAAEKGDTPALYYLADTYEKTKQYEKMFKCHLLMLNSESLSSSAKIKMHRYCHDEKIRNYILKVHLKIINIREIIKTKNSQIAALMCQSWVF